MSSLSQQTLPAGKALLTVHAVDLDTLTRHDWQGDAERGRFVAGDTYLGIAAEDCLSLEPIRGSQNRTRSDKRQEHRLHDG